MGEVYMALYHYDGHAVSTVLAEQVLKPQAALASLAAALPQGCDNLVVAGTGISILKELAQEQFKATDYVLYPQADAIITCAQVEGMNLQDPADAEPLYCRNEVTWKKIGEQ